MRFLLFILLFTLTFGCELPETERGIPKNENAALPDQIADTIEVIYSEQGNIKLKLRSPKLVMSENAGMQYNEFPIGVELDFFDKKGAKNADLVADYGYDDQRNREQYVKGNVVITHVKQGWVYTTEELFIDEKKDSIHNNGKPVKITKPDGTLLQGDSFRSNTRMDYIEIKNLFDSTLPIEESPINSGVNSPIQETEE